MRTQSYVMNHCCSSCDWYNMNKFKSDLMVDAETRIYIYPYSDLLVHHRVINGLKFLDADTSLALYA